MSTIIYPSPIFGPVHSRRLGISLGINLQPADGKVCSFDCIYCECGFNHDHRPRTPRPDRQQVATALELKLAQMATAGTRPDVLTFAGNGEPTGHPEFAGIIDDTLRLRDKYAPSAKVSVLSNATYLDRESVRDALLRVDNNIQKLDTVDPDYIRLLDRPVSSRYDVGDVIRQLVLFGGKVIIQTMFVCGTVDGNDMDNTGDRYVGPWIDTLKRIAPRQVMIYTIDRETPDPRLRKASSEALDKICARVMAEGIYCTASY